MRCNLLSTFVALIVLGFTAPAQAAIEVKTTSVGHGVEAWYATNKAVPVVDVVLSFEGAGAAHDPAEKGGLAAFSAAMLGEGAGEMSAQDFARALDEHAITLDFHADEDRLTVHVYCLREHAKRAGELLALAISKPPLAAADVARVKGQVASLLTRLSERPGYLAERLLATRAFVGHPYANPNYGTVASVASLTDADVRQFLATRLTRKNLLISAAGDVDASLLEEMLQPTVEALAEGDAADFALAPATLQGGGELLRAQKDVPQTVVQFAAPGIARDDKRFYAAYLLNEILGGGSTLVSRLGNELRQKKGLVYGVHTGLEVRDGISLLGGQLATRNSTADAALAEVKRVLADMREHGVTAEECSDAKGYVLGHFPLQMESAGDVSGTLMMMQRHHLGEEYLTEREKLFSAVSCADINAVARDLLAPEKFLFAVVGGTEDKGAPAPTPAPAHGDVR